MVNSTALISEALSANRMTGKSATKDGPITVSQRRSFGEFLESKQLCLVNSTEPWRKNIFLAKFLDANSISQLISSFPHLNRVHRLYWQTPEYRVEV